VTPIFLYSNSVFDEKWKNILHLDLKNFGKYNPYFYLSYPDVNSKNELKEDLKQIRLLNKSFICSFPYRYIFLKKYFKLPDFNLKKCKNLQNFLNSFRDEKKIGIVFSSEYSSSPQSSFGHVMLIFINNKSFLNSDVVHFAAKTKKEGFFKYSYDGLVGNFDAFYIREKLFKKVYLYNVLQQRTMFIYYLNFSENEINKLLLHLYELQKYKAKYYFISYNCSSATLDLLRIIDSKVKYKNLILPIDSVRLVKKHILKIDKLIPLNKQIILLVDKMSPKEKSIFKKKIMGMYHGDLKKLSNIIKETLNKYYEYSFRKYHYVFGDYNEVKKLHYKEVKINTNKVLNPLNKVQPSEIKILISKQYTEFDYRLFNIDKYDYQNNLTDEKTYRVFDINVIYDKKFIFNKLDFYKTESLAKIYYPYVVPLSWRVYMGLNRENKFNSLLFNYELGAGQSYQSKILFNYFVSLGFNLGKYSNIYLKPEINIIFYYKNMKFYGNFYKKLGSNYYKNNIGITYKTNNYDAVLVQYQKDKFDDKIKLGFYHTF
jgi:hypothetical protein